MFNVSVSTFEVFKVEFKRGKEVIKMIFLNIVKWEQLWCLLNFLEKYKYYLMVIILVKNEDDFKKWEGWVGSRIKFLI